MSLCQCREIINVTLPMSDGEGAFLFCAPGYESSSNERRRAVLYRKQNGDPLFLPPTNSLTPRSFSFSWCWRISAPRASPRLSAPYRETPPCPRQSVGRPFWRPAAGCRRHGRWCSWKTTPSSCCAVCRRTSSPPTTMTMRALPEESGLCPRGGTALAAAAVRGLILTVSHQDQIGQLYPQVLSLLVHGACRELF